MKRILPIALAITLLCGLAACTGESPATSSMSTASSISVSSGISAASGSPASSQPTALLVPSEAEGTGSSGEGSGSNILIAYLPDGDGGVERAASLLQETLGGDQLKIGDDTSGDFSSYEFVLLGFETENSALPEEVQSFLSANDLGARTIYPFVTGEGNGADSVFSAISQLAPGALLGNSALLFPPDAGEEEITGWADSLSLSGTAYVPESGDGNTVATATVTPHEQQVLYLWEEGNAPAVTEYTENNGGYSDDPDFRPYLTSFPVPEGTKVKGAVLICPGGAFQFRSDQPEGVDVAEALSALGYQSFVVDYRLRPYTQQEGALDLARAVRFVRAHAEEYGIDEKDIAVMGFSAGGILSGEMLLNFDGQINGTALDEGYQPDRLDEISADAAACGMIYSFYGRLSVGTTDVGLLRSGNLPPTFYCYGTRDPFYEQFLANADAAEEAGVSVERLQLDGMPHGFGARGDWIPTYDSWLAQIFNGN